MEPAIEVTIECVLMTGPDRAAKHSSLADPGDPNWANIDVHPSGPQRPDHVRVRGIRHECVRSAVRGQRLTRIGKKAKQAPFGIVNRRDKCCRLPHLGTPFREKLTVGSAQVQLAHRAKRNGSPFALPNYPYHVSSMAATMVRPFDEETRFGLAGGAERTSGVAIGGQRIVVTGAAGQLGSYLIQAVAEAGATPIAIGHREGPGLDAAVDITDARAVEIAIDSARADAIIHGAAMTDVDGCEKDVRRAEQINHAGARNVALAAVRSGAYLITISTDFVFSGTASPYAEDAATDPISVYGASKRAGELSVLEASESFAVARTAWVYGGKGKHFPRSILNLLAARPTIEVVDDERGNPTFAGDLAKSLVQLVSRRPSGIVHLTNEGTASRFELARQVAALAGLDPERIQPTTAEAFLRKYPLPARRPADSSLTNRRAAAHGVTLRPWPDALAQYIPHLAAEMQSGPV